MNLATLRTLLGHIHSHESCSKILAETATLFREQGANRWYFFLLNRVVGDLIDDPEIFPPNMNSPVLAEISQYAISGLDAIDRQDSEAVVACANHVVEGFLSAFQ